MNSNKRKAISQKRKKKAEKERTEDLLSDVRTGNNVRSKLPHKFVRKRLRRVTPEFNTRNGFTMPFLSFQVLREHLQLKLLRRSRGRQII